MDPILLHFESWNQLLDKAEYGTLTDSRVDSSIRESRRESSSFTRFTRTSTFEEAISLGRKGWTEGARTVKARLDVLQSAIPAKRTVKEIQMQPVGPGIIDMGRYMQGHPAPWITWQDTETESVEAPNGKIVTIAFNVTASAGVSADTMYKKGATIATLVDLLERSNRRVELILVANVNTRGRSQTHVTTTATIKRAEDPLDIDRLTFSLAHASTLRRILFSIWEQLPNARAMGFTSGGTYGYPTDHTIPGAINIHSTSLSHFDTEASQLEWIKTNLADCGIEWSPED